jgi:hypothetical protein
MAFSHFTTAFPEKPACGPLNPQNALRRKTRLFYHLRSAWEIFMDFREMAGFLWLDPRLPSGAKALATPGESNNLPSGRGFPDLGDPKRSPFFSSQEVARGEAIASS